MHLLTFVLFWSGFFFFLSFKTIVLEIVIKVKSNFSIKVWTETKVFYIAKKMLNFGSSLEPWKFASTHFYLPQNHLMHMRMKETGSNWKHHWKPTESNVMKTCHCTTARSETTKEQWLLLHRHACTMHIQDVLVSSYQIKYVSLDIVRK